MREFLYLLVVIIGAICNVIMKKIAPGNGYYLPYSILILVLLAVVLIVF